jgi:hypothetical protein
LLCSRIDQKATAFPTEQHKRHTPGVDRRNDPEIVTGMGETTSSPN